MHDRPPLTPPSPDTLARLARAAAHVRATSLEMVHRVRMGHPGGDLSAADILAVLLLHVMRIDPARPDWPDRDRFILSKGHASGALYATLAEAGFYPHERLASYMAPLSPFNGHPDRKKVPGVEANTGPLGHGLPIAVGVALAAKMDGRDARTYVLTGDGELQEGSNWEAAMAASHFDLERLTVIVDRNGLQQGDATERTVALEPLAARWQAFGWSVVETDGHDLGGLIETFQRVPCEQGRPTCVVARTHKGRGVSFIEDRVDWHHRVPTDAELADALRELSEAGR
jgi:transketolase